MRRSSWSATLPEHSLPLEVTITNAKGRALELGSIRRLDSAGGATFARIVPGGLDGFVDVVIRDARGRVVLRGRPRGADDRRVPVALSRSGRILRGMRVGLAIPQYGFSLPGGEISFVDTATWAHRAESLGFDGVWLSDHFLYTFARYGAGDAPIAALEPLTALAGLAAVTERVRLGVLVLGAPFRHPSLVAKAAATIDQLSGGRLELGLGRGLAREGVRRVRLRLRLRGGALRRARGRRWRSWAGCSAAPIRSRTRGASGRCTTAG